MNNKKGYQYVIKQQQKKYKYTIKKYKPALTEQDFYPPSDNRILTSNIEDINGGDNFADYCKDFFNLLDEEEYFDIE